MQATRALKRRDMKTLGVSLASLGAIAVLVGFLFAFWAHEDIKQARYWGDVYLRQGTEQAVVDAVFRREVDKLSGERLMWGLIALGGIMAVAAGWAIATIGPRALKSKVAYSAEGDHP